MTRGNNNKPTTKIIAGKYKGKVLALTKFRYYKK